jgi:UDP-N-acetylglucosamine 2-epimerase
MKIATVLGARPQFIKAAPVSRAFQKCQADCPNRPIREIIIHTGQHYDEDMSDIFFRELAIPAPHYHLSVASGQHGWQTGQMMMRVEDVLLREKPDVVLVYGDTNSTLAGALAAAKLNIPLAHVEAGLRSFNRRMPEEVNRVVVDHISSLLLCPSQTAVDNLATEGITSGVHLIGDVMADALSIYSERADACSDIHARLGLTRGAYLLATIHRAENTDDPERLRSIMSAFSKAEEPIVLPLHPRTKKVIEALNMNLPGQIRVVKPVGYLDMVALEKSARVILTDSGGIQKEAYWLGVPCVTLRDETEWVETIEFGWNRLVGADTEEIVRAVLSITKPERHPELYGGGHAAESIVGLLSETYHPVT